MALVPAFQRAERLFRSLQSDKLTISQVAAGQPWIKAMAIPTEPIGSIPRPGWLIEAIVAADGLDPVLEPLYQRAIRETIAQFEATDSPVITDGEQKKYQNFWTYCVQGLPNTAPDGCIIPFSAGHVRRMLRLTGGPFRYKTHADSYLDVARRFAKVPLARISHDPIEKGLSFMA